MPRPRKNDPTPLLKPILLEFAREIASAVERMTLDRVRSVLDGGAVRIGRGPGRPVGKRSTQHCYYPGCKNVAAPRFGMFCAALHKGLSAAEKAKYRGQRSAGAPAKLAAKRGRRSKKK